MSQVRVKVEVTYFAYNQADEIFSVPWRNGGG